MIRAAANVGTIGKDYFWSVNAAVSAALLRPRARLIGKRCASA